MTRDEAPAGGSMVHSMGEGMTLADWPALTAGEVAAVLSRFGCSEGVTVSWHSPRPMSSAAVVRVGERDCFVKRHDRRVRSAARLRVEHAVADHLRSRDVAVPRPWRREDGDGVVERAGYVYEVHDLARGADRYRDVPSWHPYFSLEHAREAGAALARTHLALDDFDMTASASGVLMDSVDLLGGDLMAVVADQAARREGLGSALSHYDWKVDLAEVEPWAARAHEALKELTPQWTHGDWHPSNLTWSDDDQVVEVLDLGLANRTYAIHDLALALERSCVDWLEVKAGGVVADIAAARALLAGYESLRPLSSAEGKALNTVLPVCHLDFALSEVEYFHSITASRENADLAYFGYLLGHLRWFRSPEGRGLLEILPLGGNARP